MQLQERESKKPAHVLAILRYTISVIRLRQQVCTDDQDKYNELECENILGRQNDVFRLFPSLFWMKRSSFVQVQSLSAFLYSKYFYFNALPVSSPYIWCKTNLGFLKALN